MEVTREIYWNIGHGVVIPMYILAFAAFGVMGWGFWQRLPFWRQGKALDRFDRYDERVKRMLSEVFSQSKIFGPITEKCYSGWRCVTPNHHWLLHFELESAKYPE
ncbi:MAG: hypothetical protein PHF56_18665 [Desulfuromonadaceae bacterium]|nr:hypothetical protein [Desulfuromonadaceae bacterium]